MENKKTYYAETLLSAAINNPDKTKILFLYKSKCGHSLEQPGQGVDSDEYMYHKN